MCCASDNPEGGIHAKLSCPDVLPKTFWNIKSGALAGIY